jgi:hypothetical protein
MDVAQIGNKKNPRQLLREVDTEFPAMKAVVVIVLSPDNEVQVRLSDINCIEACWMREILSKCIRHAVGT